MFNEDAENALFDEWMFRTLGRVAEEEFDVMEGELIKQKERELEKKKEEREKQRVEREDEKELTIYQAYLKNVDRGKLKYR